MLETAAIAKYINFAKIEKEQAQLLYLDLKKQLEKLEINHGNITKFKIGDKSEIRLLKYEAYDRKETTLKIDDELHPDVYEIMRQFIPIVREILCLPDQYPHDHADENYAELLNKDAWKVRGVSWSYAEDGAKGIVISGHITLETSDSPFIFNTPHLPYDSEYGAIFPERGQEIATILEAEIWRIIGGKRAQVGLFDNMETEGNA